MLISELIAKLSELKEKHGDRLVILDDSGDTYGLDPESIILWDDNDPHGDSPIAINI